MKTPWTLLLALFLGVCFASHCEATIYNSDGSAASVRALHDAALNGDTITLPAGTFNWSTPTSSSARSTGSRSPAPMPESTTPGCRTAATPSRSRGRTAPVTPTRRRKRGPGRSTRRSPFSITRTTAPPVSRSARTSRGTSTRASRATRSGSTAAGTTVWTWRKGRTAGSCGRPGGTAGAP